ncbi:MAG: ubiquinone biosynthesis regulatory protein kinase UbiB [Gammaproteobacteria bacterium]|nr:ubiquinone biosynthesis regulatory protein kinase UbiB [Gammaproteobacteria bacterium]
MAVLRLIGIFFLLARKRLDRLARDRRKLSAPARLALLPLKLLPEPKETPAASFRLAFEELGPIFVKFGQILSTRRDLFSPETADELRKLQDRVPPFDSDEARRVVEASLQAPVAELFARFDREPLAAASLAQIHTAQLKTGEEVVIKIIRPGIEAKIHRDLRVMYLLARALLRVWPDARRLHPVDVVADYERTILDECDLALEASNTMRLRANWNHTGKLYVPEVFYDFCRPNVMVMERIYGITAADIDIMRERGVNMKRLAHLGVEIFFTQVFEDNFFHADMHPGNVFIDITDPDNPSYIALDCAIIGSLTEDDKTYLARNLLAFFHRDYYEVARLHVESGWVPTDTDVREFEAVIRSVCEPVFQKPISEISFGRVLISLFQTARRFDMEVQPQLVLLQKTLLNIEGMGRQIYPELDLWETAAPFMEKWMAERIGVSGLIKQIGKQAPDFFQHLPELPQLALDTIGEMRQLARNNREQTRVLTELRSELESQAKSRRFTRLGGVALVAAILFPVTGLAASPEALIGSSVLGSLGIYWLFIRP